MIICFWKQDNKGLQYFYLKNINNSLILATVYCHNPSYNWKSIVWGGKIKSVKSVFGVGSDAQSCMAQINALLKNNKDIRILTESESNLL